MKILALDTSTEACSAALLLDGRIMERFEVAPRRHHELILPMIEAVLLEGGATLHELDVVAFGCGPGSFTGVRIAASVVQGIAFAHDLPVIPISTLQALAQGVSAEFADYHLLPAIDARMDELYYSLYKVGVRGLVEPLLAETVCAPAEVTVDMDRVIGIGSGWDSYATILTTQLGAKLEKWLVRCYPKAADIALLAARAYQENKTVGAELALPVYLRDPLYKRHK